jgi:hypothetical protein
MSTQENIRKDADSGIADVKRLREELLDFAELNQIRSPFREIGSPVAQDLEEFRNRVAELLDRIYSLLSQIKEAPTQLRRPEEVFPLSILAQELKAQVEWLEGILSHLEEMISSHVSAWPSSFPQSVQVPLKSALAKIKSYLIPLIKKFLSKLWSIISGLLTPKEWKLKGKVGTGLLGLADVEVEVTFGP